MLYTQDMASSAKTPRSPGGVLKRALSSLDPGLIRLRWVQLVRNPSDYDVKVFKSTALGQAKR